MVKGLLILEVFLEPCFELECIKVVGFFGHLYLQTWENWNATSSNDRPRHGSKKIREWFRPLSLARDVSRDAILDRLRS